MNQRAALKFVLTAGILSTSLFGILRIPWVEQNLLLPFTGAQWKLACAIGADPEAPITVSLSCSAADVIALCLGFILAFPVAWRRRLAGAGFGLLLIAAVNTFRIASLSRVVTDRNLFNTLHVYVWPAALLIVVSTYVFLWMGASLRAEQRLDRSTQGSDSRTPAFSRIGRRFVLLTLVFVGLFVGSSGWWMKSDAVLMVANWVAASGAAIIRLFGGEAAIVGNIIRTSNGGFVVTQECIMTPLMPVYFAAVLSLSMSRSKRCMALLLSVPIFFLLGSGRLLVLAFPTELVGSPLTAIHGFHQIVLAALLIAFASFKSKPASDPLAETIKRSLLAVAMFGASAIAIALTWNRLLFRIFELLDTFTSHAGHRYIDDQHALAMMAPYQIGLLTGLFLAWRPSLTGRQWLGSIGLLVLVQLATVFTVGEWAIHTSLGPHVALIRAWSVLVPVALFLALAQKNWAGIEPAVTSLPEASHG